MKPEEKVGMTIKILVDTFGNKAGDYVEILEADGKSIYYEDGKGKRCRFLNTQANVMFRFEEPAEGESQEEPEEKTVEGEAEKPAKKTKKAASKK